jgi:hypothetical protein
MARRPTGVIGAFAPNLFAVKTPSPSNGVPLISHPPAAHHRIWVTRQRQAETLVQVSQPAQV